MWSKILTLVLATLLVMVVCAPVMANAYPEGRVPNGLGDGGGETDPWGGGDLKAGNGGGEDDKDILPMYSTYANIDYSSRYFFIKNVFNHAVQILFGNSGQFSTRRIILLPGNTHNGARD